MAEGDFYFDVFSEVPELSIRRMFGGLGIFADKTMFALVADGDLYLKVDDETLDVFEAAGCLPFVYTGKNKPIQMSYWTVPEEFYDDIDERREWTDRAIGAAMRAKT